MVTILVIGGNGFFGRKLVIRLLQDEAVSKVISMDMNYPKEAFMRSTEKYADKFHFVRGDVSQLEDILDAIKSFSIEKVANFAYIMSRETEDVPRLAAKVNVLGMSNVFEAARLLSISRVIYASSIGVYGLQSEYGDREITEEDPLHPSYTYGITKLLNEIMAAKYSEQYGMSIIGLRPSHGFGHGRQAAGVSKKFSEIVSLPATGKPVFIEEEGSHTYSLISADDVAELTRILLRAPSPKYTIYNVAGPPESLGHVANTARQYIPDAKIEFGHESEGPGLVTKISMDRSKDEFSFSLTPLKDTVFKHINEARLEAGLDSIKP